MTKWIPTHSGKRLNPLDPHPDDILIADIARGLAFQCRYAGQVERFYSTAEHSVRISYVVPSQYRKAALLHDSPEAYINDVVWSVKSLPVMHGYRRIEDKLLAVIFEKYQVGALEVDEEIKHYDKCMVPIEASHILANPANIVDHYSNHNGLVEGMAEELRSKAKFRNWGWDPLYAKVEFLSRCEELGIDITS